MMNPGEKKAASAAGVRRPLSPAWLLFFLSPAIGELLSGSAPPAEFFNPFAFALFALLYGSGAILVREFVHRWSKGWASLLVLGAAYGIVEEGLLCKSFFDPNWPDVGILGSYGRWGGVNWIWSLQLTAYHATISIATPILLVGLIFPERRAHSWISRRTFVLLSLLLAAEVLLGALFLTPYRPPVVPYLLAAAAVIGLFLLARALPHPLFAPRRRVVPRLRWFWLTGFLAMVAFFVLPTGLHAAKLPAPFTVFACLALYFFFTWLLLSMSGHAIGRLAVASNGASWSDFHRFVLAAGALSFFVLLAPIQELENPKRPDNTLGMSLVGLAFALFLFWIWRRMKGLQRRETAATSASGQSVE